MYTSPLLGRYRTGVYRACKQHGITDHNKECKDITSQGKTLDIYYEITDPTWV